MTTAGALDNYADPVATDSFPEQPLDIASGPDGALWFTSVAGTGATVGRITVPG